jgi:Phosphoesterase family
MRFPLRCEGFWSRPSRRRPARMTAMAGAALAVAAVCAGAASAAPRPSIPQPPSAATAVPRLDHVFVIVEENNGFRDVIGNPAAPNLNSLARTFGLATGYFGISHPSEPNYVALLGGNTFGISSDDAYWTQEVHAPSLISQLDRAGLSWKAYLQAVPHPGYQGICYPAKCNGAPDSDPLYVAKHDGIQNYLSSQNPFDWSRQVPIGELPGDLRTGNVPRFSYVIPDECHDMHGDPPYCLDSGNIGDPQNQHLVAVGDAYLGQLVSEITGAPFWAKGNNAIVVTYDEGDNNAGCCDASPGGGRVATVVITSHGPRGLRDATPANHYSLLSTIEHGLGLGCVGHACDTAHVHPMPALFAVTGAKAIATRPLPVPDFATPTPTPIEPTSMTKSTASAGGWTVQRTALAGTNDNSLGAVAGSSPSDVWAAGNFLPDTTSSNQDATLTFAEHYDGTKWSYVPTPNTGANFNSFYGLAASGGQAWAVGERLNRSFQDRALAEWWNGSRWSILNIPQPGSIRDMLFAASALSPSDVWVVGDQEGRDGKFGTLAEHWNGTAWSVTSTPDPGPAGNHLYAVAAVAPDDVWAVGQRLGAQAPDQGLVEHWNGQSWAVVNTPASAFASVMLDAVTVHGGQVWAAGEADSPRGGRPVIVHRQGGRWQTVHLPASAGSSWTNLYGIADAGGTVWAAGTFVDPKTGNNETLILRGTGNHWTVDHGPDPGSGSNILGGLTAIGGELWAAGTYDNGGSRLPLAEHR